jgi:hypothetical protein
MACNARNIVVTHETERNPNVIQFQSLEPINVILIEPVYVIGSQEGHKGSLANFSQVVVDNYLARLMRHDIPRLPMFQKGLVGFLLS